MIHNLQWRKSRRSDAGDNCVEVATPQGSGLTAVRDSKDPDDGMLAFGNSAWGQFLDGIRSGAFTR